MLVKLFEDVNNPREFEIESNSIREVLNYIKNTIGDDVTDSILYEKHLFLGRIGNDYHPLTKDNLIDGIALYPELIIVKTHEGNEPISAAIITAASYAAAAATSASLALCASVATASAIGTAVAAVAQTIITVGLTMGASMAVSAIMSPDSTFGGDPSQSQKGSKLFNQSLITREQGGSVPLCYGNPFCGGVLISSGITSKERTDSAASTIQTPTNSTPVNGHVGESTSPTLTASAFAMDPGETGTHLSSDWVISTNIGFTNIVKSSYRDTTNKTSITFTGLKSATTYYWRVRYRTSDLNTSAWSSQTSFTTA